MKNEENKVLNAIVNLQVCPKCNGASECCKVCEFAAVVDCSTKLTAKCTKVLSEYFMHGKAHVVTFTTSDYESYVSSLMREIGIPAHINGYQYIRRAIVLAITDNKYIKSITKALYPTLAKEFDATAPRVERGIRHAIEIAWNRCDIEVLDKYFGNTIDYHKGKPTNSEFIAMMVEITKLHFRDDSPK